MVLLASQDAGLSPLHRNSATSCFPDKNCLPKETQKWKRKGKETGFGPSALFFRLLSFLSALPLLVAAEGRAKEAGVQPTSETRMCLRVGRNPHAHGVWIPACAGMTES
jgi:hypothetical protein